MCGRSEVKKKDEIFGLYICGVFDLWDSWEVVIF